jgi:hypothetical protein
MDRNNVKILSHFSQAVIRYCIILIARAPFLVRKLRVNHQLEFLHREQLYRERE